MFGLASLREDFFCSVVFVNSCDNSCGVPKRLATFRFVCQHKLVLHCHFYVLISKGWKVWLLKTSRIKVQLFNFLICFPSLLFLINFKSVKMQSVRLRTIWSAILIVKLFSIALWFQSLLMQIHGYVIFIFSLSTIPCMSRLNTTFAILVIALADNIEVHRHDNF